MTFSSRVFSCVISSLVFVSACSNRSPVDPAYADLSREAVRIYEAIYAVERTHSLPVTLVPAPATELISRLPTPARQSDIENRRISLLALLAELRNLRDDELYRKRLITTIEYSLRASQMSGGSLRLGSVSPYLVDHVESRFVSAIASMLLYADIKTDADAVSFIDGLVQIANSIEKDTARLAFDAQFGEFPPSPVLQRVSVLASAMAAPPISNQPNADPTIERTEDGDPHTLREPSLIEALVAERIERLTIMDGDRRERLKEDLRVVIETSLRPALMDLNQTALGLVDPDVDQPKTVSALTPTEFETYLALFTGTKLDSRTLHVEALERIDVLLATASAHQQSLSDDQRIEQNATTDPASTEASALSSDVATIRPIKDVEASFLLQHQNRLGLEAISAPLIKLEDESLFLPLFFTHETTAENPLNFESPPTGELPLEKPSARTISASLEDALIRSATRCNSVSIFSEITDIVDKCRLHAVSQRIQSSSFTANRPVPIILNYLTHLSYDLGWSSYLTHSTLEVLDDQWPSSNPLRLTELFELERLADLVVDTGLHGLGWSRAEAVEWLSATFETEPMIAIEIVDHRLARPGWATAATYGQAQIARLKDRAQRVLSTQFSRSEFNLQMLKHGSRSFEEVEKDIDAWLAEKLRSGS